MFHNYESPYVKARTFNSEDELLNYLTEKHGPYLDLVDPEVRTMIVAAWREDHSRAWYELLPAQAEAIEKSTEGHAILDETLFSIGFGFLMVVGVRPDGQPVLKMDESVAAAIRDQS
jgi:hypothetical protein